MGLFGISEVIASIKQVNDRAVDRKSDHVALDDPDARRLCGASGCRCCAAPAIGSFFGALPGTGGTIASFMSYAVEKKVAKEPERFGKGAIEGVTAPEAANNAADQTAFIPTLTLGIPARGDGADARRADDPRHHQPGPEPDGREAGRCSGG
jgi:TctA family transporter